MENFTIHGVARRRAGGTARQVITGVVASGNLEVLVERSDAGTETVVAIATAAHGFRPIWEAVVSDFIERASPGGVRISINDGGARPDTVALRLMQGIRLLESGS